MGKAPSLKTTFLAAALKGVPRYKTRWEVLDVALAAAKLSGWVAEFGVREGKSLREIAKRVRPGVVHGFDSFEGLQEDWTGHHGVGSMRTPHPENLNLPPNSVIHRGLVQDTVPEFVASQSVPARFIHVDTDTYMPAASILANCNKQIVKGTVILFDEYWSYDGWEEHEARAFCEWLMRENRDAVSLCICRFRLAVLITR
jgi:hypothetical protein